MLSQFFLETFKVKKTDIKLKQPTLFWEKYSDGKSC